MAPRNAVMLLRTLVLQLAVINLVASSGGQTAISSRRVLSRQRRFFLPQAQGWSFYVPFQLNVPLEDIGSTMNIVVPFTYFFDTGVTTGRRRSSQETFEESRHTVLNKIESYLRRSLSGFDAHACVLRAICEASATPLHSDGVFGQMVNALLMPAHLLELSMPVIGESDYLKAQRKGQQHQECQSYFEHCSVSLFKVDEVEDYYYNEEDNSYSNVTVSNYV